MRWSDIPRSPTDAMLRQFAGIGFVFFGGIGLWQWLGKGRLELGVGLLVVAVVLGAVGLIKARLLRPVFVGWIMLAFPIGWLISNLVMAAVFFGLFLPIGLVFRLKGRDALSIRKRGEPATYWQDREPVTDPKRYFQPY